jgi:hypothetical protein
VRILTSALDAAQLRQRRSPLWRLLVYDVRSTSAELVPTRIGDVVLANLGVGELPDIVGPLELTSYVQSCEVQEVAGDYAQSGVASGSLQLVIVDEQGTLDPLENPPTASDPEAMGRWLRQGNVVVLFEGEQGIDPDEWPITFTGKLVGQPGQIRGRTLSESILQCFASGREADYLPLVNTSESFPESTSFLDMMISIAERDMGLAPGEYDFSGVGAAVTRFNSTQATEESPLVSLAKMLFPEGAMPRFDGRGVLVASDGSITKAPARIYDDAGGVLEITRPRILESGVTEVKVLGLSPLLERVIQTRQELATAQITTGFFARDARIRVKWSQDGTQQALHPSMQVIASIGDSLFAFGDEGFSAPVQSDGGTLGGVIRVDGGLEQAIVFVSILAGLYISTTGIPDFVVALGAGVTVPFGRVIHGAIGQLLFATLARQGRGEYRILGEPYEYVFPEVPAIARIAGVLPHEQRPLLIENHLVNAAEVAQACAERVLRKERARINARAIVMLHDLRLEPDDLFEVSGRRYWIQEIRRTLVRDATTGAVAQYSCAEVTPGVRP